MITIERQRIIFIFNDFICRLCEYKQGDLKRNSNRSEKKETQIIMHDYEDKRQEETPDFEMDKTSQARPTLTKKKTVEAREVRKLTEKEIRGKRRVKLSPPRNESVKKEISIVEPEDERTDRSSEDTEQDERSISGTVRNLEKQEESKFPDVLALQYEKTKARLSTLIEHKTYKKIQILKEVKKIKSISGLIEAAVNEFIEKYHLED